MSGCMIERGNAGVPCVGGPLDGALRPFLSCDRLCVSMIGPLGVRHQWYELRTWRKKSGEYKDRWVYLGWGGPRGPKGEP